MVDRNAEGTATGYYGDATNVYRAPPAVKTRKRGTVAALNTRGVVHAMQASQRSLDETRAAFLRGQRVDVQPRRPDPQKKAERQSKILAADRLPKDLRVRHKMLAAKLRARGAKSPMHLAAMQVA